MKGVAAAQLAGRTLAELIVGHDTERTQLPWVGANQCTYPLLLQLRATAVRIPEYCSYM